MKALSTQDFVHCSSHPVMDWSPAGSKVTHKEVPVRYRTGGGDPRGKKKYMWWQGEGIMVEEAQVCVYMPRSHPKNARMGALLQSAIFTPYSPKERGSPCSRSWRLLSPSGKNYVLKKFSCACLLAPLLSLPGPNLRTKSHDKSHFIFTDKSLLPLRSIPKNCLEPQTWTWI